MLSCMCKIPGPLRGVDFVIAANKALENGIITVSFPDRDVQAPPIAVAQRIWYGPSSLPAAFFLKFSILWRLKLRSQSEYSWNTLIFRNLDTSWQGFEYHLGSTNFGKFQIYFILRKMELIYFLKDFLMMYSVWCFVLKKYHQLLLLWL